MTAEGGIQREWETHAGWWQQYFTDGADPEYVEQILPLAGTHLREAGLVLDLGCGEGQLARHVTAPGTRVVGLDAADAQLRVARERGGGPEYVRASALAVPLRDGVVDAVVACLVMEHVEDLDGAVAEVTRVLRPGGRFVMFINHPLLQTPGSGWVDDHILEEQYWRVGPYLPDDRSLEEVAPGVHLVFVHRPLHRYVNTMTAHGLLLEHLDEPAPPSGFLARADEYAAAATIPRLMVLRARKVA